MPSLPSSFLSHLLFSLLILLIPISVISVVIQEEGQGKKRRKTIIFRLWATGEGASVVSLSGVSGQGGAGAAAAGLGGQANALKAGSPGSAA